MKVSYSKGVATHTDPESCVRSGSGRRQLAELIASSSNPLTARVMVNRVWQSHFGRGIVLEANNFGVNGGPSRNLAWNYPTRVMRRRPASLHLVDAPPIFPTHFLQTRDNPEMFFGEIVGFTQIIRQIIEFDLFPGHDQLPISFADGNRLA